MNNADKHNEVEASVNPIMMNIPFNKPFIIGKELEYIADAVSEGHLSGNGPYTVKCQHWMENEFNAGKVLLTHSCTAALEMAAILADIGQGDEVIMPSYTFVSTANAFLQRGAQLVWCDIREDTLNMDEGKVEALIGPRTKAIVPVHYAGVACEMDVIMEVAERHQLFVIEDAAQAVAATYKGKALGTIGHLGCYSFHETKNFISGEGGALVINDKRLEERAEIIWEKGTNRSKFFRGEVDKYTWVDIGSSYLPSELVAAFLFAQLEEADRINKKRLSIWNRYYNGLEEGAHKGLFTLPVIPADCLHNAHLFRIVLPTAEKRDALMLELNSEGIRAVFHYVPLHSSPMGRRFSREEQQLPNTESIASRLLRLPLYYGLTEPEQDRIIRKVLELTN